MNYPEERFKSTILKEIQDNKRPRLPKRMQGELVWMSGLSAGDIGKDLGSWLGKVKEGDVGKLVFATSYGLAMENDEQRDARRARGGLK